MLCLTPAGSAAADHVFRARREGLETLLAGWSPEQHADLAQMLDRLSRALLGDNADRRQFRSATALSALRGQAK
jgi:hypothetical protein